MTAGRPLRVLFVTDARPASWTGTCLLAGSLPLERFRVTLGVVGPPPAAAERAELVQLAPHAALTILEGTVETDRAAWAPSGPGRAGTNLDEVRGRLELLCERLAPDVVHLDQLALAKLAWPAPRIATVGRELLTWGRAVGRKADTDLVRYRAEVKAGLGAASVVVAPSAWLAREVERRYELAESVRVVRQGAAPASHAAIDRGFVAIARGSLDDPADRLDLLVAAASRLPGPVGVVGEGPARSFPRPLVALGTPARKDVLGLLAGARIYLGLSRHDPSALAVAEAQGAGARLVLLDQPTYRELWSGAADFVHDADSLVAAVARAHVAPRLPRPVAPRYAISQTAAAYARLCEELCPGEGASRAVA